MWATPFNVPSPQCWASRMSAAIHLHSHSKEEEGLWKRLPDNWRDMGSCPVSLQQDWDACLVSLCLTWLICPLPQSKCIADLGLLSLIVRVTSFPFSLLSCVARGLQLSPPSSGVLWYYPAHSSNITSPLFINFQLLSSSLGHFHSPCKHRATFLLSALSHMVCDSWGFSCLAGLTLPTVSICDSGSVAWHIRVCT